MPYADPEKERAYQKEYRQTHREKLKAWKREHSKLPQVREQDRLRQKDRYRKHKIKWKERRMQLRMKVLSHYSHGEMECACCGTKHIEFLTINHIHGGGLKHCKEIGRSRLYEWLVRNNFPLGFNVLCWNCNEALAHYGYCPHEEERGENNDEFQRDGA